MESSVMDVKADEPKDGSTVRLTKCRADEPYGSTARFNKFVRRTTATHGVYGWE